MALIASVHYANKAFKERSFKHKMRKFAGCVVFLIGAGNSVSVFNMKAERLHPRRPGD